VFTQRFLQQQANETRIMPARTADEQMQFLMQKALERFGKGDDGLFTDSMQFDTACTKAFRTHRHPIRSLGVTGRKTEEFLMLLSNPDIHIAIEGGTCCSCCSVAMSMQKAFVVFDYAFKMTTLVRDGFVCIGCARSAMNDKCWETQNGLRRISPCHMSHLRPFNARFEDATDKMPAQGIAL
jgi:hypothetical protein